MVHSVIIRLLSYIVSLPSLYHLYLSTLSLTSLYHLSVDNTQRYCFSFNPPGRR